MLRAIESSPTFAALANIRTIADSTVCIIALNAFAMEAAVIRAGRSRAVSTRPIREAVGIERALASAGHRVTFTMVGEGEALTRAAQNRDTNTLVSLIGLQALAAVGVRCRTTIASIACTDTGRAIANTKAIAVAGSARNGLEFTIGAISVGVAQARSGSTREEEIGILDI